MKAQNAVYPIDAISNYSDSVRKQFFLRGVGEQEGLVKVKPELTKCIEFKQLNLIHPWKIPTEFDFIFCRNVMIYFEADTKAGIIDRFYQNLKSEGNLFLGHSESIPRTNNNWTTIGKNIYKARAL
jgi:chemotaxis protein methyltransferase CheR